MESELQRRLTLEGYPRSATYDPVWVLENLMGPNVLWLTEALTQRMQLTPGMRVLDLGCGKALSSIFLAREFGVQVWATDLWIGASDNWGRIRAAGLEEQVYPIHAEAHSLPFAECFFDTMVSLDAYHYFGTDDLYLSSCSRFVRPGGEIGIVCPGIRTELGGELPAHLRPYWDPDFWSFHSPEWWQTQWERSRVVRVETADMLSDGWRLWLSWLEICGELGYPTQEAEAEMLRVDAGRTLGFTRVVGRKPALS
jgi:cyclopropane fatty-acyl-phospholipid synthase-like methyltransferase